MPNLEEKAKEWWNNWVIKDWNDLQKGKELFIQAYLAGAKELEKENRILGERCNQLLKDKGDLTDQIADIKANCDLAIEGRDVKIDELEEKNSQMFNTIALQEQQIEKMKCCANCDNFEIECRDCVDFDCWKLKED